MTAEGIGTTVFSVQVSHGYIAAVTVIAFNLPYTGQALTPPVMVVSDNGLNLTEGEHYQLKFVDNIQCGVARAEVTGIGACADPDVSAPIIRYFTIVPALPDVSSLAAQSGGIRLSVTDMADTGADGYEAQYRLKGSAEWTNASFEVGQTELVISGLPSGEYEVRVCAFVDNTSASVPAELQKVVYGSYSDIRTVTVP